MQVLNFGSRQRSVDAFWQACAQALHDAAPADAELRVFVPHVSHIEPCRQALARLRQPTGRCWRPPPVLTLDGAARRFVPRRPRSEFGDLVRLLADPDTGADAADRLSLARRVVHTLHGLESALVWSADPRAGLDSADPGAELRRLLRDAVDQRGWPIAEQELRVFDALRASLADADPRHGSEVLTFAAQLAELAAGAQHDFIVLLDPTDRWAMHYARLVEPARMHLLVPDWPALARLQPILAAAWPEAFTSAGPVCAPSALSAQIAEPIGRRRMATEPHGTLEVLRAEHREDEAQAAARWVRDRGASGPVLIAAADIWLARRLRALLERAGVIVDDTIGWRLSTTVAASALMRWFDLIASDCQAGALLCWLDNRFVQASLARAGLDAGRIVDAARSSAARSQWLSGWSGLAARIDAPDERAWFERLAEHAQAARRRQTPAAHLRALRAALAGCGLADALLADAAGAQLFDALAEIDADVGAIDRTLSAADWRALLDAQLDARCFVDHQVDSPVRIVGLDAIAAVPHEALLILGANRQSLPAPVPGGWLFSERTRGAIGLVDQAESNAAQLRRLALALALSPHAALTCRDNHDEAVMSSPWIERLLLVAPRLRRDAAGFARSSLRALEVKPCAVVGAAAPIALPARISPTGVDALMTCPYRYYVMHWLGLRGVDEIADAPERRELGQVIHSWLHKLHTDHADRLHGPQSREFVHRFIAACARKLLDANPAMFTMVLEWQALIDQYVDWIDARQRSGWRFKAGERSLRRPIAGAGLPELTGTLDRIDEHGVDAVCAVIDYKAGATSLKRRAQAPFAYAQLPLYAALVQASGDLAPPRHAGFVQFGRNKIEDHWLDDKLPLQQVIDTWLRRLESTLSKLRDGALLRPMGAQADCDRCAARGVCRRAHWSNPPAVDGAPAR